MEQHNKEQQTLEVLESVAPPLDLDNLPESKLQGTKNLTEAQQRFAVLYSTRAWHKMTIKRMAQIVGFSERNAYKCIKNKDFRNYCEEILDQQNKDFISIVYKELQDIIVHGREKNKLDAIKVWLSMYGKLDNKKIEIVHSSKHETDAEREARLSRLERELLEDSDGIYRPEE